MLWRCATLGGGMMSTDRPVVFRDQPTVGELRAIELAREQLRRLARPTTFDASVLSNEGCWRVLAAPWLPVYGPRTNSLLLRIGMQDGAQSQPIALPESLSLDERTVGMAGAALCVLLVGLEALYLAPATELPRANCSIERASRKLINRMRELASEREMAMNADDKLALERERHELLRQQWGLLTRRQHARDPAGSPRDRFIRFHLASVYGELFRIPVGHSSVGPEKCEVGGPFVRFAMTFAHEVGMAKFSKATVAAALDAKKATRRKRQTPPVRLRGFDGR